MFKDFLGKYLIMSINNLLPSTAPLIVFILPSDCPDFPNAGPRECVDMTRIVEDPSRSPSPLKSDTHTHTPTQLVESRLWNQQNHLRVSD